MDAQPPGLFALGRHRFGWNRSRIASQRAGLAGIRGRPDSPRDRSGPAENQMSTGFVLDGCHGSGCRVPFALGSHCRDLPAFVAIPDPRGVPQVGPNHWNSAFLPAAFQGTPFNADRPIPHLLRPATISEKTDVATRDFVRMLNDQHLASHPGDNNLAARIASYEM